LAATRGTVDGVSTWKGEFLIIHRLNDYHSWCAFEVVVHRA
jgi:hypothetical protein